MHLTDDVMCAPTGDSYVGHVRETGNLRVYHPKQTTCLRCGELFDSFDPRYNRRCESCTKSVHGHDDRYNY